MVNYVSIKIMVSEQNQNSDLLHSPGSATQILGVIAGAANKSVINSGPATVGDGELARHGEFGTTCD